MKAVKAEMIRKFEPFRTIPEDELHILNGTKKLYKEFTELFIKAYLRIARNAYLRHSDKKREDEIDREWIIEFLLAYDEVAKYVFMHEMERKQARFAEALIASKNKSKEVDTALHLLARQAMQAAIEITDEAVNKAYKDNGVKKVRWVTEGDERVCIECMERDGKVYILKNLPPKPHYGCRCYTVAVI